MKRIVSDFTSNTSGHGWGMIDRTTSKFGKALWIAITLISTIAAIIWVSTIIARFVKYETKDRVEVEMDDDVIFPSVTLCPLYGSDKDELENAFGDPNSDFIAQTNFLNIVYYELKTFMQITNESSEFFMKKLMPLTRSNRGFYENMGVSKISDLGLDQHNFVANCFYQESECAVTDFQMLVHHEYKNCFTFNGGNINLTKPIISQSGAQKGLSLTLFLDTGDDTFVVYDPSRVTTAAAGVKVVVHEKGTLPDPDNEGFDVEPGHLINVALTVNRRQLMKPPWGECADHTYLESTDFKYTRNTCKTKCMEREIQKRCGCKKDFLPVELNSTTDSDLQVCGQFNREEWMKAGQANATILNEDIARLKCVSEEPPSGAAMDCDCKYNCSDLSYNMETSQSVFPMSGSELDFFCQFFYYPHLQGTTFVRKFNDKIGIHCSNVLEYSNVSRLYGNEVRANFLRLNVYFKNLDTKYIIQEEDFTVISMVSEIGGVLGIFIGVSIITILEVFVLISSIVSALINNKKVTSEIMVRESSSTQIKSSEKFTDHMTDDSYNNQFAKY